MPWNMRVIRHNDNSDAWLGIHECYYINKSDKIPHSWAAQAMCVVGESREELTVVIAQMKRAIGQPILEIETDASGLQKLKVWEG